MSSIITSVVVTYLYPKKGMSKFDKNYYEKHHIPTTVASFGPLGMISCVVYANEEDAEFAYSVITVWKGEKEWKSASASKEASELAQDVKNFMDVEPLVVVGKVWMDGLPKVQ